MAWVKLDDKFFVHRKAIAAGVEGRALFVASMCYCAMQENNGEFTEADLPVIAAMAGVPQEIADRLVEVGLWDRSDRDYLVHDYLTYNPSSEQIAARRKQAEAAAAARYAKSSAASSPPGMPIPSPSPASSSSSSSTVSQTELAEIPEEVWEILADRSIAATSSTIKNLGKYRTQCIRNAKRDHGARAVEIWQRWEIKPSHLADVLANGGSSQSLNHLPRKLEEPAA